MAAHRRCPRNLGLRTQLAGDLEQSARALQGKYLSSDGHVVNYKAMRASSEFSEYKLLARELAGMTLADLTPAERKAFFLSMTVCARIRAVALFNVRIAMVAKPHVKARDVCSEAPAAARLEANAAQSCFSALQPRCKGTRTRKTES